MRTRAKICGITRSQDIDAVVKAGADAIGFVFDAYAPSEASGVGELDILPIIKKKYDALKKENDNWVKIWQKHKLNNKQKGVIIDIMKKNIKKMKNLEELHQKFSGG